MKNFLYILPLLTAGQLFAEGGAGGQKGGYVQFIVMLALAIVFFYFILLRPEQKRRKAAEALRNSMSKGDKVTAMGLLGTVEQVLDNTVILKMYDGAKIEVLKAAITDVKKEGAEPTKA